MWNYMTYGAINAGYYENNEVQQIYTTCMRTLYIKVYHEFIKKIYLYMYRIVGCHIDNVR